MPDAIESLTAEKLGNQTARSRRQAVRAYRLHRDGMTVKAIAALIGKEPRQVSSMIKIGERFDG